MAGLYKGGAGTVAHLRQSQAWITTSELDATI